MPRALVPAGILIYTAAVNTPSACGGVVYSSVNEICVPTPVARSYIYIGCRIVNAPRMSPVLYPTER